MSPVERLPRSYDLHVHRHPVARLEWRGLEGWHLHAAGSPPERLDIDGIEAREHRACDDDAAALTLAPALDHAARRLVGPPTFPRRPAPAGPYELHITGVACEPLPLAFPEAGVLIAGDTAILSGHFDDAQLQRLVRRVGLLGGRLLALLPAV